MNKEELYEHAVALAREKGGITARLLMDELHVSQTTARNLVQRMEDECIVGPARGPHLRDLLNGKPTHRAPPARRIAVVPSSAQSAGVAHALQAMLGGDKPPTPLEQGLMLMGLEVLKQSIGDLQNRLKPNP